MLYVSHKNLINYKKIVNNSKVSINFIFNNFTGIFLLETWSDGTIIKKELASFSGEFFLFTFL